MINCVQAQACRDPASLAKVVCTQKLGLEMTLGSPRKSKGPDRASLVGGKYGAETESASEAEVHEQP